MYFRESPLKLDKNSNSIKLNSWAYKTKLTESIDLFARDHFSDIKHRREITLALDICKDTNSEQKIGAKALRLSLENKNKNLCKFNNQVLKGFAITWHKQTVVHYINLYKLGMYSFSVMC